MGGKKAAKFFVLCVVQKKCLLVPFRVTWPAFGCGSSGMDCQGHTPTHPYRHSLSNQQQLHHHLATRTTNHQTRPGRGNLPRTRFGTQRGRRAIHYGGWATARYRIKQFPQNPKKVLELMVYLPGDPMIDCRQVFGGFGGNPEKQWCFAVMWRQQQD